MNLYFYPKLSQLSLKATSFAKQFLPAPQALATIPATALPKTSGGLITILRSPHVYKKSREQLFVRQFSSLWLASNKRELFPLILFSLTVFRNFLRDFGCNLSWKTSRKVSVKFSTKF